MTSLGVKRAFCNMAWQRLKHVGNPGNALVATQSSHRAIMLEICRLINSASSERTELPILKSHCDWSANMLDWDGQQKSPEHSVAWVCIWQSDVWLMACDCNLRRRSREILITPSSAFLSQNWGCDQTSGWPCCCCCCCDQMSCRPWSNTISRFHSHCHSCPAERRPWGSWWRQRWQRWRRMTKFFWTNTGILSRESCTKLITKIVWI